MKAYRKALKAFRNGKRQVLFPEGTWLMKVRFRVRTKATAVPWRPCPSLQQSSTFNRWVPDPPTGAGSRGKSPLEKPGSARRPAKTS